MLYAKGIAHISFTGGGMFLPARNPYDREVLIEYVAHYAGLGSEVQILVDDQRWLVQPRRGQFALSCVGCGSIAEPPCCAADGGAVCCIKCALGGHEPVPAQHQLQRDAERSRLMSSRAMFGAE
jgi:hypothetical protein